MTDKKVVQREGHEVTDYNPVVGVQSIVLHEAAEKYYRKAKDLDRLFEAVEGKLEHQREFVLWWDGQEKGQGQRTDLKPRNGSETKLTLDKLGVDRMTVSRWLTKRIDLDTLEKIAKALGCDPGYLIVKKEG